MHPRKDSNQPTSVWQKISHVVGGFFLKLYNMFVSFLEKDVAFSNAREGNYVLKKREHKKGDVSRQSFVMPF